MIAPEDFGEVISRGGVMDVTKGQLKCMFINVKEKNIYKHI